MTFMIYAVKILLVVWCANYVKIYYVFKVICMLPDINLLDFKESVVTVICLVDKISLWLKFGGHTFY